MKNTVSSGIAVRASVALSLAVAASAAPAAWGPTGSSCRSSENGSCCDGPVAGGLRKSRQGAFTWLREKKRPEI